MLHFILSALENPALRNAICLSAAAAIAVLAVAPSAWASYRHALQVWAAWQNQMLLAPAFWLWLWASWMAVALPCGMLAKTFPFLAVVDARALQLAKTLGAFVVIAMGSAVFWQFLAWGSLPVLAGAEIRYVPFRPWPESRFTPYLLGDLLLLSLDK